MSASRYSIISGDFVWDDRPTDVHRRVMEYLGSKTDRYGWCVFSQTKLADSFGCARETINRAIRDLVAWGYVEKQSQTQTHRAICAYRVLMDRHEPPADLAPDEDDDGGTCDVGLTGTCDAVRHTRVTQDVTLNNKTPLNNDQEDPPTPRAAERVSRGAGKADATFEGSAAAAALILELQREARHVEAVEALLAPILSAKRFSAEDKLGELRRLRDAAADLPRPLLERAARLVIEAPVRTIKPDRIRSAIAVVRDGGQLITITRGSANWQRWLGHFQATDPRQARLMATQQSWLVPSAWPPARPPPGAQLPATPPTPSPGATP